MDLGFELDYRPRVGKRTDFGIAIVGSGAIVRASHLPAYRLAGFNVVGITSRTPAHARAAAAEFKIPRVYASVAELLADPAVQIVDIAVPPHRQRGIAEQAFAAGKHVMAQKPLADTYADALAIVEAARRAGVKLAVNQNGRWDPAIRAARDLIQRGWLGRLVTATIELRTLQPWQEFYQNPRWKQLMLLNMSVHHLDQFRFLFGEPARISAFTTTWPGQPFAGDTIALYVLEYESGLLASSLDDGFEWADDYGIDFRFTGTEGIAKGTIGWPDNTYSTLRFVRRERPSEWYSPVFETKWFPHAFIGTMGELMLAIEEDREPSIGGADNLKTLQLVFAGYRSAAEKRAVAPSEIG